MAKLYPRHPRPGATRGERRVLELLANLDDNWYVLHSLDFVSVEKSPRPGEADFVLLHRSFGMLVLEVKDGHYRIEKRRWTAVRSDGTEVELDRDPFQQAKNNRFALRNLLKQATGIRHIPIGHCVLFTDGRPSGPLGFDGPEAIVLTLASLANPTSAVRGIVNYWQHGSWSSDEDFRLVLDALCPTSVIAPTLDYTVDISGADLERLTERQIAWTTEQLEVLTRTSGSGQTLVLGAAGTGKTVIAQERARSLISVTIDGRQRIESAPEFVAFLRRSGKKAGATVDPCQHALQLRALFKAMIGPDGRPRRKRRTSLVKGAASSATATVLDSAIRAGFVAPVQGRTTYECARGSQYQAMVAFARNLETTPGITALLDGLCSIKGCTHIGL